MSIPTVLVIDDDLQWVSVVREAVADTWTCYTAMTGPQGLQILRQHHDDIDVVLLDLSLPDMEGRWVGVAIRTEFPHIAIVPFTADTFAGPMLAEMGCLVPLYKSEVTYESILTRLHDALYAELLAPDTSESIRFLKAHATEIERKILLRQNISERQREILAMIGPEGITSKMVAELLRIGLRTAERDLNELEAADMLYTSGSTKARRYYRAYTPQE